MFENGFSTSNGPRTRAPRNLNRIYSHGGAGNERPPSQPLSWISQIGRPVPGFNRRNTYIEVRAIEACDIVPGLLEGIVKAESVAVVVVVDFVGVPTLALLSVGGFSRWSFLMYDGVWTCCGNSSRPSWSKQMMDLIVS